MSLLTLLLASGNSAPIVTTPDPPVTLPAGLYYRPAALDVSLTVDAPTVTLTEALAAPTTSTVAGSTRAGWASLHTPGLLPTVASTTYATQRLGVSDRISAPYSVEVNTEATALGVVVRSQYQTGLFPDLPMLYRIYVDGLPATASHVTLTAPVEGEYRGLVLTWPTAQAREIRIDLRNVDLVGMDHNAAITNPAARPKLLVIGDSWVQSPIDWGNSNPILDNFSWNLKRLIGADVYIHGIGSTGYSSTSISVCYNSVSRQEVHAAVAAPHVIVYGSQNDNVTDPAVYKSSYVAPLYTHLGSLGAAIFVVGPNQYNTTGVVPISEAAAANPDVIGFVSSATWLDGTTGVDAGGHLTLAGNAYWAKKVAEAYAAAANLPLVPG